MKKTLIFILLLSILFSSAFSSVIDQFPVHTPEKEDDLITLTQKKITETKSVNDFINTKLDEVKNNGTENNLYFIPSQNLGSFDNINTIMCPSINTTIWKDYYSRIDYLDFKNGIISCSAISKKHFKQNTQNFKIEKMQKFYSDLNPILPSNYYPRANKTAIKVHEEFEQQQLLTALSYSEKNPKILNYGQLLTAIAGLNNDVIDISTTIETGILSFNNGYFYVGTTETQAKTELSQSLELMREISKELLDDNGFGSFNPFEAPKTKTIVKSTDDMKNLAENQIFVFLIEMIALISPIYNDLLVLIIFAIVLFNIGILIFNNLNQNGFKGMGENAGAKAIATLIIAGIIVASFASSAITIRTQNSLEQETQIQISRIQIGMADAYMHIAEIGDEVVKNIITAYLSYVNRSGNIDSVAAIKSIEIQNYKKHEELSMRQQLDTKCSQFYDLQKIKDVTDQRLIAGKIATNKKSIYPATEKQALEMARLQGYTASPYSFFLKNSAGTDNLLSISFCSNNQNQIRFINKQIDDFESKIDNFNNPASLDKARVESDIINNTMWTLFDRYGYFSIAFLPVVQSVKETLNIVKEKEQEYKYLLFDSESKFEDYSQFMLKNIMLMSFFDTSSLQMVLDKIISISPTSWIPFIGDDIGKAMSLSITLIIIDFLSSLGAGIKIAIFMITSLVVLTYAFLHQFVTLITVPYAAVVAFSTRQVDSIISIGGNILFAILRPLFTILAIVIALIFSEIFSIFFKAFTAQFELILSSFESIVISGFASLFSALFVIVFYLIQYYIIFNTITQLPKNMLDILSIKATDMTSQVADKLENQLKGVDDAFTKNQI